MVATCLMINLMNDLFSYAHGIRLLLILLRYQNKVDKNFINSLHWVIQLINHYITVFDGIGVTQKIIPIV